MGAVSENQGIVIAVGGLSGSGKSTLTRSLANILGEFHDVVRFNTDEVRKELWGIAPREKLPDEAYLAEFSNKTYQEFNRRVIENVQAGKLVLSDSVFATPFGREGLEAGVRQAGGRFYGYWLDVPADSLRARVNGRFKDVSDADERVLNLQLSFQLGQIGWRKIDASGNEGAALSDMLNVLRKEGLLRPPGAQTRIGRFFFPG